MAAVNITPASRLIVVLVSCLIMSVFTSSDASRLRGYLTGGGGTTGAGGATVPPAAPFGLAEG
jgi:hypothetical protein